jgi:hypothetical protein
MFSAAYLSLVWGCGLVNEDERQLVSRYASHGSEWAFGVRLADRG